MINEVSYLPCEPVDHLGYRLVVWKARVGSVVVADLALTPLPDGPDGGARFGIVRVATSPDHQRRGYAAGLYRAASTTGTVYHSVGNRITADGKQFAAAVGGPHLSQTEADRYLPPADWSPLG